MGAGSRFGLENPCPARRSPEGRAECLWLGISQETSERPKAACRGVLLSWSSPGLTKQVSTLKRSGYEGKDPNFAHHDQQNNQSYRMRIININIMKVYKAETLKAKQWKLLLVAGQMLLATRAGGRRPSPRSVLELRKSRRAPFLSSR